MNSSTASLINAFILIIFGTASFFLSEARSFTAFIPVIAGIILLFMNRGVKSGNKLFGHIAVLITLIILAGLVKPFLGAMHRGDHLILAFIVIMMLTSLMSMIAFIMDFIKVRQSRGKA